MKKIITTIAVIGLCAFSALSQNTLRTAYFLDGYTASYKLNPAIQNDRNFVTLPVLGNINIATGANVGLGTFLYPAGDGTLNTFMSPEVSETEFLSKIQDKNLLGASENITLMATGFRTGKLYHTIDISLKTAADLNAPGDLFRFLKRGDNEINFTNMGIKATSFAEIAYGISRPMGEKATFGIRAKALVGLGRAEAKFTNASITATEEKWTAYADGVMETEGAFYFDKDETGKLDYNSFSADENYLLGSYGLAVDLGVKIELSKLVTLSIAATDIGGINWNRRAVARTPGETWEFDGFDEISADSDINAQVEQMEEELEEVFSVYPENVVGSNVRMIAPTVMAGLEIKMPFSKKLSAGILGTYHIDGAYSWYEGRVSANMAVGKVFSCSASVAGSNYGISGGLALNLHANGFSFFLGTDNLLPWARVSNYYIPVDNLNVGLTMGLAITFGEYRGKLSKNR